MEINKIYNENCLETMYKMKGNFIDMILTSPPYEDLRKYNGFNFDFKSVAMELFRVTKNGGVVVWVVSDQTKKGSESGESFRQSLYFMEIGFKLYDTMFFKKINPVPLNHKRYEQCIEYMFVFSKGKPKTFNPILVKCKHPGKIEIYGRGKRGLTEEHHSLREYKNIKKQKVKENKLHTNVFEYVVGNSKVKHSAPFPEKLAYDQIITWTNKNDLIYDPFMGSGTTGKMAKLLERNFIGSEISKQYCMDAEKRISLANVQLCLY